MIYVALLLPCGKIKRFEACEEVPEIVKLLVRFNDPNIQYDIRECPHYLVCKRREKK